VTDIISKIRKSDGRLVRVHADGREELLSKRPIRAMKDAEIEAAATSDPDARPLTKTRPMPRIRTLRRALGLTQEEFSTLYRIPLGTLRDWEQGRSEPDQPARAYLTVIACDPEGVRNALQTELESR